MPSWKKILLEGADISVAAITSSQVPGGDGTENLIAINGDGGFVTLSQGSVSGEAPIIKIQAFHSGTIDGGTSTLGPLGTGSYTEATLDSGADLLQFGKVTSDYGFGFSVADASNTSSISIEAPQALKSSSSPTFENISIGGTINHDGDDGTHIRFVENGMSFTANNTTGIKFVQQPQTDGNTEVVINNTQNHKVDFKVKGLTNEFLFYVDSKKDKIRIGSASAAAPVGASILTVDGGVEAFALTASNLPVNTTSIDVIVDAGSGKFEKRNFDDVIGAATASLSASIVGTSQEIEVTTIQTEIGGPFDTIKIGLPDDVQIDGDLEIIGDVTASNIHVSGNIALGGNIFSFSGFSFIEGISAVFTGSNIFGSGSSPEENDTAGNGTAHQFTGSVAITGSGLTVIDGGVTAANNTGSFGYLTALEISSSGNLFASLSNDDSAVTDGVVVYDNTTCQFFTTSSDSVGQNDFDILINVPDLLVSGTLALVEGDSQGAYDLTIADANGTITLSDEISSGLLASDDVTFNSLTTTTNAVIGTHLTASGDISASGNLFADVDHNDTVGLLTVVYNSANGQFFTTGSYGGGGGGGAGTLGEIQALFVSSSTSFGIVSQSFLSAGGQQGEYDLTVNGNVVSDNISTGLTPTDNPTFANLTVNGNLNVEGNTTTISTTNLAIEDRFILLSSGSGIGGDAGIVVENTNDGSGDGIALFFDVTAQMWSIDQAGASASTSTYGGATRDAIVVAVQSVDLSANSLPGSPAHGGATNQFNAVAYGQLLADISSGGQGDIYVWSH